MVLNILLGLLRIVLFSLVISAVFCGFQWLFFLVGIAENGATWDKFLWGALGIAIFLAIYTLITIAITMYRMYKDPIFKDAHLKTGISWKDYKKITGKDENT